MEFEKLKEIILEVMGDIDPEKITPDADFSKDLKCDSLDTFQIIMALEDNYGIKIEDDAAMSIKTVGDAVEQMKLLTK